MRPFAYRRAPDPQAAVRAASMAAASHATAPTQYIAGGTTLLDLMKLDVMQPTALVDITGLDPRRYAAIEQTKQGLRIGALARMADVADDATIKRDYPVLSESLWLAASAQLRNMARVGGNVLQRTRCPYFRDITYACNKREPGSGCSAIDGYNRLHAVLGTSDHCIASYPGDWAQGLIALDAYVELLGKDGPRSIRFAELHRQPGETPQIETNLRPGELITGFVVPGGPWPRSLYLKIRDRASYEFALASVAVALKMDGDTVREARIALGGVASVPWRASDAEAALVGKPLDEAAMNAAAEAAFAGAKTYEHNAYKVPLGKATIVRALTQAKTMEA